MGAEPPKIRMHWREVAKDERKAERISKFSVLDNRRILRRRAVFLHSVHSADPQNRRRSLSRHTPPKRIHSNKLAARAVHDRVRADSRRMADDKFSAPAAHFLEAVHCRADYLCRLSDFFGEKASAKQRYIFACSVPLAVFLPCLNPSVFWFAGSFTFLVPFAALLITVTPLTFEVFGGRVNPIAYIAAAIASVVAASQEQSCAAVLALQVILLIFSAYQRRLRFRQFIPLLPSAVSAAVLILSPGLRGRGAMEAASGFERFSKMNIFEKLLCGFSNYFAFSFFFSLITAAVFLVLLGASVYEAFGGSRKIKKIISVFAIFASALCVGVNAAYIIIRRTTPDKGFEKMFKSGNYLPLELAVIALCFVFLFSIFILIAALIKKNKKLGFTVGVLFSAAVCCAAVLGFSSSVYASGQRVFYFTEMFTLIACAAMYSSLSDSKAKKFAGYAVPTAAFIFYIINCFTYTFLEIPIMG